MHRVLLAAILIVGSSAWAAVTPRQTQSLITVHQRVEENGTQTLVHEVVVTASPAEVWKAISTPDGWREWAVPVAWHPKGKPDVIETSYDPEAAPGAAGTIQQRLLAAIPGHILVFQTVKAPAAFPHWQAYRHVTNFFEVDEIGPRSTRVRLIGVGYPGDQSGREALNFFKRGNSASLTWLRDRFATGPADWKKRLAPPK